MEFSDDENTGGDENRETAPPTSVSEPALTASPPTNNEPEQRQPVSRAYLWPLFPQSLIQTQSEIISSVASLNQTRSQQRWCGALLDHNYAAMSNKDDKVATDDRTVSEDDDFEEDEDAFRVPEPNLEANHMDDLPEAFDRAAFPEGGEEYGDAAEDEEDGMVIRVDYGGKVESDKSEEVVEKLEGNDGGERRDEDGDVQDEMPKLDEPKPEGTTDDEEVEPAADDLPSEVAIKQEVDKSVDVTIEEQQQQSGDKKHVAGDTRMECDEIDANPSAPAPCGCKRPTRILPMRSSKREVYKHAINQHSHHRRDHGAKNHPNKRRHRNPFIAFFLSMYRRRPRKRAADVARQAGRQWCRMSDRQKSKYRNMFA